MSGDSPWCELTPRAVTCDVFDRVRLDFGEGNGDAKNGDAEYALGSMPFLGLLETRMSFRSRSWSFGLAPFSATIRREGADRTRQPRPQPVGRVA